MIICTVQSTVQYFLRTSLERKYESSFSAYSSCIKVQNSSWSREKKSKKNLKIKIQTEEKTQVMSWYMYKHPKMHVTKLKSHIFSKFKSTDWKVLLNKCYLQQRFPLRGQWLSVCISLRYAQSIVCRPFHNTHVSNFIFLF